MAHFELIRNGVRVTLDDECGEGWWGDYSPSDPEDDLLMRFTVDVMVDGEWRGVDDASYCTQIVSKSCSEKDARGILETIMGEVYEPLQNGCSIKKTCEFLSWIEV